jgi:hypothetical protein
VAWRAIKIVLTVLLLTLTLTSGLIVLARPEPYQSLLHKLQSVFFPHGTIPDWLLAPEPWAKPALICIAIFVACGSLVEHLTADKSVRNFCYAMLALGGILLCVGMIGDNTGL